MLRALDLISFFFFKADNLFCDCTFSKCVGLKLGVRSHHYPSLTFSAWLYLGIGEGGVVHCTYQHEAIWVDLSGYVEKYSRERKRDIFSIKTESLLHIPCHIFFIELKLSKWSSIGKVCAVFDCEIVMLLWQDKLIHSVSFVGNFVPDFIAKNISKEFLISTLIWIFSIEPVKS